MYIQLYQKAGMARSSGSLAVSHASQSDLVVLVEAVSDL